MSSDINNNQQSNESTDIHNNSVIVDNKNENETVKFTQEQIDLLKSLDSNEMTELLSDKTIDEKINERLFKINNDALCANANHKYSLLNKLKKDYGGDYIEVWNPRYATTVGYIDGDPIFDWTIDQRNYVLYQYKDFISTNSLFMKMFKKKIQFEEKKSMRTYKIAQIYNDKVMYEFHPIPVYIRRLDEDTAKLLEAFKQIMEENMFDRLCSADAYSDSDDSD